MIPALPCTHAWPAPPPLTSAGGSPTKESTLAITPSVSASSSSSTTTRSESGKTWSHLRSVVAYVRLRITVAPGSSILSEQKLAVRMLTT